MGSWGRPEGSGLPWEHAPRRGHVNQLMRILVRTSRWAIWARRLGSFAVPLAVIPVLMHRAGAITTNTFAIVAAVAILVAAIGLVVALAAFVRIWNTGDHGWGRAVSGLLLSLLCLVPVGLWGVDSLIYPAVGDVTTDTANPPPLVSGVNPSPASAAAMAQLALAFPNVHTRNYPLPAGQVFDLANTLVIERSWDVRRRREPSAQGGDGEINAIATTLFGFRDEVAIRVAPTGEGTSVAMRSTSLAALDEPGVNGSRIEEFLTALDARIALSMKDVPAGAPSDEGADSAAPDPVAPAPLRHERKR